MVDTYSAEEEAFYYIDETTFGVTPNAPAFLGHPCSSINPNINANNLQVRGCGSINYLANKRGRLLPELKIKFPVPSAAPTNFLQYFKPELGKSLSLNVLYYKGAFTTATDILSLLYTGMRFNKTTITCDIDGIVEAEVQLIGQNVTTGTAKVTDATYAQYSGVTSGLESYVKIAGSTDERAISWRLEIDNGVRQIHTIKSNAHIAKYVPFGSQKVTGEVTFEFESKTELDELLADTEKSAIEFGIGGANYVKAEYIKWDTFGLDGKIEDFITATVPFTARGATSIA
jgi:hypothetical protein